MVATRSNKHAVVVEPTDTYKRPKRRLRLIAARPHPTTTINKNVDSPSTDTPPSSPVSSPPSSPGGTQHKNKSEQRERHLRYFLEHALRAVSKRREEISVGHSAEVAYQTVHRKYHALLLDIQANLEQIETEAHAQCTSDQDRLMVERQCRWDRHITENPLLYTSPGALGECVRRILTIMPVRKHADLSLASRSKEIAALDKLHADLTSITTYIPAYVASHPTSDDYPRLVPWFTAPALVLPPPFDNFLRSRRKLAKKLTLTL